jgi:enediyne biosynthesis protein E4
MGRLKCYHIRQSVLSSLPIIGGIKLAIENGVGLRSKMCYITYRLFFALILVSSFAVVGQLPSEAIVPVSVETLSLGKAVGACTGRFVAHDLDHISTVPSGERVRMFEANGGGVGINDLDNDGDLDIVLANHAGSNTILWNEGGLNFRRESMRHGDSRAVTIVDIDGDGQLDIIFSRTNRAPTYWHNEGSGRFTQQFLNGVGKPLYAINWADLDNDGDLDLVGATYDASLLTDYGQEFLTSGNGGVYYYENQDGYFQLNTLATNAQALALALVDLNNDNRLDIWVGNDFGVPDEIWYRTETGWQQIDPLTIMSYSTMSLDFGDIDNDGHDEVFSTDMKPLADNSTGETALRAIIDGINADPLPDGDPQVTANVLQSVGNFTDIAPRAGVEATGWSWSGKFGDLDQDGFLDLYVVNGFIEVSTFAQLPNQELVEENQVFWNTGTGQFVPVPDWGLGSTRSGRGMSMADLDGDGDLDVVVNNLRDAAELFENQLCEGQSLQVDLLWPESNNTRAIGATLVLRTDRSSNYRDVKAASGYISGDAARSHFGFSSETQLQLLEIQWPDGAISSIDTLRGNVLIRATRGG